MRTNGQRAQDQTDAGGHQEERPDVHERPQVFHGNPVQFDQEPDDAAGDQEKWPE